MENWIKSYHVFLPGRWGKWIVYAGFPVLLFAAGYLFAKLQEHILILIGMSVLSMAVVSLEGGFDYFSFGGIASRDTNKLEYFKTSAKGMCVLKRSLITDAIRRLVEMGLILFGINTVFAFGYSSERILAVVLSCFGLCELVLTVTRHFSNLFLIWLVILFGAWAESFVSVWLLEINGNLTGAILLLAVFGSSIAAASRIRIIKKANQR